MHFSCALLCVVRFCFYAWKGVTWWIKLLNGFLVALCFSCGYAQMIWTGLPCPACCGSLIRSVYLRILRLRYLRVPWCWAMAKPQLNTWSRSPCLVFAIMNCILYLNLSIYNVSEKRHPVKPLKHFSSLFLLRKYLTVRYLGAGGRSRFASTWWSTACDSH